MRQIILAVANRGLSDRLKTLLEQGGLTPILCNSGSQTLQIASTHEAGGLLISTARLPDMTLQQLMQLMPDTYDCLALLTAEQRQLAAGSGIYQLVEPINAIVFIDWARQLIQTRQIQTGSSIGDKAAGCQPPRHGRESEDQKIIEQAKYLLMNRKRMTEPEAHRYLQQKSMRSGLRMADIARKVMGT